MLDTTVGWASVRVGSGQCGWAAALLGGLAHFQLPRSWVQSLCRPLSRRPGREGALRGEGHLATVRVPLGGLLEQLGTGGGGSALPHLWQRSGLEARGADVRLVEGVGAVHHLGRRGRAGGQHGAQGLVAAEHRREVLHLLRELLDLLAQSRVLFLQVFALL